MTIYDKDGSIETLEFSFSVTKGFLQDSHTSKIGNPRAAPHDAVATFTNAPHNSTQKGENPWQFISNLAT